MLLVLRHAVVRQATVLAWIQDATADFLSLMVFTICKILDCDSEVGLAGSARHSQLDNEITVRSRQPEYADLAIVWQERFLAAILMRCAGARGGGGIILASSPFPDSQQRITSCTGACRRRLICAIVADVKDGVTLEACSAVRSTQELAGVEGICCSRRSEFELKGASD